MESQTREFENAPKWELFMRLYLANERRLYGFIVAITPHWGCVDDIIQESAIVMWTKFDEFEPGTDFAAWAMTIARYQVLSYMKSSKHEKIRFSTAMVDALGEKIAEASKGPDARLDALRKCLKKLGETDRKLVQLRYAPNATTKTVADRVGKSIHAVYKALNRIHAQLLMCIQRTIAEEERA